jgi:hypothetical protein
MTITENAKAFYKKGNATTASSLLDHFLGEYNTRYYMHQGHVTYMLTNGFAWSKPAHPEGFTAFALFPRNSSNPSSSSEFNQQAFRQLAGAQLETSDIVLLTNKKYHFAKCAYDVQFTIKAMAQIACFFGGKDCVLASELFHFVDHVKINWETYDDLIVQQPLLGNMILSAIDQAVQVYLKVLMSSPAESLNAMALTSIVTSFRTHQADIEQRRFLMTLPSSIAQYLNDKKRPLDSSSSNASKSNTPPSSNPSGKQQDPKKPKTSPFINRLKYPEWRIPVGKSFHECLGGKV